MPLSLRLGYTRLRLLSSDQYIILFCYSYASNQTTDAEILRLKLLALSHQS